MPKYKKGTGRINLFNEYNIENILMNILIPKGLKK